MARLIRLVMSFLSVVTFIRRAAPASRNAGKAGPACANRCRRRAIGSGPPARRTAGGSRCGSNKVSGRGSKPSVEVPFAFGRLFLQEIYRRAVLPRHAHSRSCASPLHRTAAQRRLSRVAAAIIDRLHARDRAGDPRGHPSADEDVAGNPFHGLIPRSTACAK